MIIKDETLDSVRKLHYLLSSLSDSAAKVLGRTKFEITNFEVAWEKLVRRFDNVNVRLFSHLENFMNCPSLRRRSASEMNRILDTANETVQGLRDLNCPFEHYDVWFIHIIVKKLDLQTQESSNIHNEEKEGMPKFKDLITFLQNRAHSLIQTSVEQDDKSGKRDFDRKKNTNSHATTLEKSKYVCPQYKSPHSLADCNTFKKLNVIQRRDFVKLNQLCFNCMLGKHPSKFCRNRSRCSVCNSKHHLLLHSDNGNTIQTRNANFAQEKSSNMKSNNSNLREINDTSQPTETLHAGATFNSGTLLATAKIRLQANGRSILARAFIDPGSECSFVTSAVTRALNLKLNGSNAHITGVGCEVITKSLGRVFVN